LARMAPAGGGTIQRAAAPGAGVAPPAGQLTLARPVAGPAAAGPATAMPALQHAVIQRVVATPLPPIYPRPAPAATAPIVAGRASLLTVRRAPDSPPMADDGSDPVSVQRLPAVAGGELPDFALSAEPVQALAPAVYRGSMTAAAAHAPGALPPLAPLAPAVQRAPSTAQDFVAFSAFAPPLAHHTAHPVQSVIDAPVQRELAAAESPAAVEASAPVAAAAPGAGAGVAASPAQSDHELDELARKLHDRISLHLRRDLLIQRERAGLVTDLR